MVQEGEGRGQGAVEKGEGSGPSSLGMVWKVGGSAYERYDESLVL